MTSLESTSKSLLDVIASSKDKEQPSKSLIAVLGGKTAEKMDKQFKLPDLVATKEGEEMREEKRELLKPLPKPLIKPRAYPHKRIDKEKIKLGAAIQREQQKQKAEELLQKDIDVELTQEEMEEKACTEDAKQQRAQWYKRRAKEKRRKRKKKPVNSRI